MNNVLVVEDELIVAQDIVMQLKNLGYSVPRVIKCGEDVLEAARQVSPVLVLMDIRLGGDIDGVDAAGMLREEYDVPIIYLTAFADPQTLERVKSTCPGGYIMKPVNETELHTTIELALHNHFVVQKQREAMNYAQSLLKYIGDAVITTDSYGKIVYMNDAAIELTGWKFQDAENLPLDSVLHIHNKRRPVPVIDLVE
ncbi:response regulator, partial [bacterium]|nr:response regulator [bacterium]